MTKQYEIEGVTVEVDGGVYFIPTRELKAYRVPDAVGPELRPALDADVRGHSMAGGRTVASVKAAFGWVPLNQKRYSGPFGPEDFITISRVK